MPVYHTLSDHDLAILLKEGDHHAYAEIYNKYWAVLYRYSRKLLQSDSEAGDIVQDVFVMLWSKSPELDVKVSLSSFLYASVRNRILKHFERSKVRKNYLDSLQKFIDEGFSITDQMVRERELVAQIEQEIELLPAKMREVFELSRKENMSYREISKELNITENTVKKQVSNALKTLRLKISILLLVAILFI